MFFEAKCVPESTNGRLPIDRFMVGECGDHSQIMVEAFPDCNVLTVFFNVSWHILWQSVFAGEICGALAMSLC